MKNLLILLLLCVLLSCDNYHQNNPNIIRISSDEEITHIGSNEHKFVTCFSREDSRSLTIMHSPECPLCNKRRLYTDSLLLELTKK